MSDAPEQRRSLLRLAPLGVFLLLATLLLGRLFSGDASRLPSPLIGHAAPAFDLPAIEGYDGAKGLSDADLREGHVSLLNVFASWCPPCRAEHRVLMALSRDESLKAKGVRLYGLSYKDEPANARKFLQDEGSPFTAIGADYLGMTSINLGVYGVPETYIVRGDGVIAYKYVGPLTPQIVATTLMPEIEKALSQREVKNQ
jgi:cytochrome c biogenesis protein CcmG, thiol:disulfide interchange protein DsbE